MRSIWSYGNRNPEGLSWNPRTGLLWSSEHGPVGGDEINIIEPGSEYGWRVVTTGTQRGIDKRTAPGMVDPIVHYTPSIAPSGITFVNSDLYFGSKDNLLVAGLAGQQLRRLVIDGRQVTHQEIVYQQFGRVRTVAQGPDGYLYMLLQNLTGSDTGLPMPSSTPGRLIKVVSESR